MGQLRTNFRARVMQLPPSPNVEDMRQKGNRLHPEQPMRHPDSRPEQRVNRDFKDSKGGGASVDDVIDDIVGGSDPREKKGDRVITRKQFQRLIGG